MSVPVDESEFPDDIGGHDPGAGEMDLFAVCWRSDKTPAKFVREHLANWIAQITEFGLQDRCSVRIFFDKVFLLLNSISFSLDI